MTLRPGWWEGHVIPPAVRPYLISYEFGKSSTRLFTGRLLWDYLVACGLQIHAVLEIAQVHHICTVYDPDFTFNPNSRWGKQILALPLITRVVLIMEEMLRGGLFFHARVTRKRILPLISRKRTCRKHHFDHLCKSQIPPISKPIILPITPTKFTPQERSIVFITPPLPYPKSWMLLPDHDCPRSKPREGVG
jgi:hypothetical protein